MKDLNANDVEAAAKMIAGSARSMGIEGRSHEQAHKAHEENS